jgi:hypothetical protein
MNRSPVAALVRSWFDLYTRGMPQELRATRRDEVDDDLWCQHEEAAAFGRTARSIGADMFLRLLFGIPADISWRLGHRHMVPSGLEGRSTKDTRSLGVSALVGGLTFAILLIAFIPFSHSVWEGSAGVYSLIGTIVGVIAFSAAALGLAWRFQDHIGPLGGLGAIVTTFGAVMSMFASIVPLLVGSAMLMWDLARIGVMSWVIPVVQTGTVIATVTFAVARPNLDDAGTRALLVAVLAPYLVTWIAIGIQLVRGSPRSTEQPSGG